MDLRSTDDGYQLDLTESEMSTIMSGLQRAYFSIDAPGSESEEHKQKAPDWAEMFGAVYKHPEYRRKDRTHPQA